MKRRKLLIVCALLLLASPSLKAQNRLGVGLEWGFGYHPTCWHADSYHAEAGYRLDVEGWKGMQHVNGFATLSLDYELSARHSLSLSAGKRGVGNGDRVYPLQLRFTWHPLGNGGDSPIFYIEDGAGYNRDARVRLALTGGLGAGYRYRLGSYSCFDMLLKISTIYYRPDLYDPDTEKAVPTTELFRHERLDLMLECGIAIHFR